MIPGRFSLDEFWPDRCIPSESDWHYREICVQPRRITVDIPLRLARYFGISSNLALISQGKPAKSLTVAARALDIVRTIDPALTAKALVGKAKGTG